MAGNIASYIFLGVVIAFIYLVNSINLKKNRAIHARAVMLNLKGKHSSSPESVSADDLQSATDAYNAAAIEFNASITAGAGAFLNVILRYPEFEPVCEQE